MEQIARLCFPAARRVTDRFHVQKLAYEAVQDMRVKARWEALDEESVQIAHAKACGRYIMRRSLKTVIHANSFFREAFTCYIRRNPCGRNHSAYAPASCSGSIPILRKHTTSP